ncbi:MAG: protein kinase [Ktedonobacteraceae bacterium]|nr:protein kinase [Ktedonobacteraceae bacterium]
MAYQAGQKLGNYQLERFLGHGGFAEVYLGKHIYLNTYAAIKVLQRQSSDEALEKFLQEARIIAGLKHPHIVGVLDFGIEEQRPFLVMAYVPHGTLRRRYGRGKALSPVIILPHVQQIAGALQYAHERKIIHRDVKPENMLLDGSNAVQLSDFGLALRERSTYHSVHSSDSAGTTVYMSPEQLKGKPSTASDQYALGVVMYEWLCGCLPFDGPDISIVVQHLHEPPVPLREHIPTLSPEIEAVVLKALEKDPKQRFANMQELAAAFTEACKGIPVPENAVSLLDAVQQRDALLSVEQAESWVDVASGESIKVLPDSDIGEIPLGILPERAWPSHYSSLQAPSLSASLNMSSQDMRAQTVESNDVADVSTIAAPNGTRISRRTAVLGLVGISVLLGGVGIWRASSSGIEALPQNAQVMQKSSDAATSVATSQRRTPGNTGNSSTPGTGGTNPAAGSGTATGTTNPVTTGKGRSPGTSPPSTPSSSSGNPAATSTPGSSSGGTPVATSTATMVLTVQINVPSSITQNSNVPISVMTNSGNVPFTVTAEFYYVDKNGQAQNDRHANISGNTTDSNGNATLNWQCWHIPPGQLKKMTDPRTVFQAIATDGSGKSVYSQTATAQVV